MKLKYLLSLTCLSLFSTLAHSQISVGANNNANALVTQLVGPGVTFSGATCNCDTAASGIFVGGPAAIGISNGIALTSGSVANIPGPNSSSSAGIDNLKPGDADITALAGDPSFDACVLEFDFVCISDTVMVTYLFGSEEYNEFVGAGFNDHFAFFLSGPGIVGAKNIALVPGSTDAVSINNVNLLSHSSFYINNDVIGPGSDLEYDGYTVPLVAKHAVTPGSTYHIKLVVADVFDGVYDSGVLMQGNSFRSGSPWMTMESGPADLLAVEGCAGGLTTIERTENISSADTVTYTVTGTAINGTDYALLDGELIFVPGDSSAVLSLDAISDGVTEGTETVTVLFTGSTSGSYLTSDSVTFTVYDRVPCDAGADQLICLGDAETLGGSPTPGIGYLWSPTYGLSDPALSNPTVTALADTTILYVLTSTDRGGCAVTDTVEVVMSTCTGLQADPATVAVRAFPNPANDHLTVSLDLPLQEGMLTDMLGRVLVSLPAGGTHYELPQVANLPVGTYLLTVTCAGATATQRVAVTR